MMRYRITDTAGRSITAELNPTAVLAYLDRGSVVVVLGLSPITVRVNAVREVGELLALEDITDDQYGRATGLMRRHGITADELNELHATA